MRIERAGNDAAHALGDALLSSLHAEVEDTMSPLGSLGKEGRVMLYECHSCGAVVYARFTHAEWHREQDAR